MSGSYTVLVNFDGTNGANPFGLGPDIGGTLYGTTFSGGATGGGTVFSYDTATGQMRTLVSFTDGGGGGTAPQAGVVDVGGTLYGTTSLGGTNTNGTVFALDPGTGQIQFPVTFNGIDGSGPESGLTYAGDGLLYGMTPTDATDDKGVLYDYNPVTGQFQKLLTFNGIDGSDPTSSLLDLNGLLYGTTRSGGSGYNGTVFSYDPATGQLQTLVNFDGTDGGNPYAGVIGVGGVLYGVTQYGGTFSEGTLFSYDIATGQFRTLVNFDGTDGALPIAGLTDVNGTLYGTTYSGGTSNDGTLFAYSIATGQVQTLFNFNATAGIAPDVALVDVGNTLYGATQIGGTGSGGTLFAYTLPCFAAGTRLRTAAGSRAVERLRPGEVLVLADGRTAPVVWIGRRSVDCRRHPQPARVWPVRVADGAFGPGLPARALWLSPDHALFIDGALIPVKYLIDGGAIAQQPVARITYYHVELSRHDVLLAEGLPVESYLDDGGRARFTGSGGAVVLHPDFATRAREAEGCAPLIVTGPALDAARARLAAGPGATDATRGYALAS